MTPVPTDTLKQDVFDRVAECRKRLAEGEPDMSGIDDSVRAYCEALATLAPEESRARRGDLEAMMQAVTELGEELTRARDTVRGDLQALERVRKANVAYQRLSGAFTTKRNN